MNTMERRKLIAEIGSKVKKTREMLKISPDNLAARMGVSRSSYNKYEYGLAFPNPAGLKMLAVDLDISLDWLIANKGPTNYKEKKEMTSGMAAVSGEVNSLLAAMERIPLLRYEVLTLFHKFILEHKDLMNETAKE